MSIELDPVAGGVLNRCVDEAILLAMKSRAVVKFTHNGRVYTVDPDHLHAAVEATRL